MAIDPTDTSDLRLPDELQFVAEQLVEDADHLERTFPANAPRNWRRAFAVAVTQKVQPARSAARIKAFHGAVQEDRRSGRLFGSVAAASVFVVLAAGLAIRSRDGAPRNANPNAATLSRSDGRQPGRIVPASVFSGIGALLHTQSPQPDRYDVPMGADYFNRVFSGPEQEAVIDVFREHEIPEPSVRY